MELTKEYILGAIKARNDAAINALLGLYARQTSDEQQTQATSHKNGMGFNGLDADILSSFAEQVIRKRARGAKPGTELSEKQLNLLRSKLIRYSRQLLEIAEEKQAARAAASPEKGEEQRPSLPSGLTETENGWRLKTARDFYNEGYRLDLNSGMVIDFKGNPEPISEFERAFA